MTRSDEGKTPRKSWTGLVRIWRALLYSFAGLAGALRNEPAFRLEVAAGTVLAVVAVALPATLVQTALLLLALLLVLIVELLNSAVEATVDRISLEKHELAKQAKDMASAAVLLSLVSCALVWGLVLYDIFG